MKGGRQPGAGRPKGAKGKKTIAREALQAYFEQQARDSFKPILAQYLQRAKDGNDRILIDLFNRLLGKPPESVQLSGGDRDTLPVRVVHQQLADPKESL